MKGRTFGRKFGKMEEGLERKMCLRLQKTKLQASYFPLKSKFLEEAKDGESVGPLPFFHIFITGKTSTCTLHRQVKKRGLDCQQMLPLMKCFILI